MTGQKIQVVNPDGSQDTYFTYLRGTRLGQSDRALLNGAMPIFSSLLHSAALFAPMAPPSSTQFTGIAMQNPGPAAANVTVGLYSSAGTQLGSMVVALPAGNWIMKEIAELTGVAPAAGDYARLSSSAPIEAFGFLADDAAGSIAPFAPIQAR
jgi:hypothetical protein